MRGCSNLTKFIFFVGHLTLLRYNKVKRRRKAETYMGKSLILRSPDMVIPALPEFEKVDEKGKKIYSEIIIKYYTSIPTEFDHYLAPIIRRSNRTKSVCVLEGILDIYYKNPLLKQLEELYSPEFVEKIKQDKKYMFDEDEIIPVRVHDKTVYEVVGVKLHMR